MSTESKTARKTRTSPGESSPNSAPEGDHRKRRRNRTTQSCLNCHASKRMCDRKRPCGRCTQLGLTGLCVYEVDDPSQRSDTLDESSRLRQRVAELEGVIRELKNKPHPRWVNSGSTASEEFERCHARTQPRSASEESAVECRHQVDPPGPLTDCNAGSKETLPEKQTSCQVNTTLQQEHLPSFFSPPPTGGSAPLPTSLCSPQFDSHSLPSAPSTGIVTPTEEHSRAQIAVAGLDQDPTNDDDLTSFLMSYPGLLQACDDGPGHVDHVPWANTPGERIDLHSMKYSHRRFLDHCGCLDEAASYNVVLELSVRLRKAADTLGHFASHRFNNACPLNQKIVDLDTFATTTLGNMPTSPSEYGLMRLCSRTNAATGPIPPTFSTSIRAPANAPLSVRGLGPWNGVSYAGNPSASRDESFMTWEPSRWI